MQRPNFLGIGVVYLCIIKITSMHSYNSFNWHGFGEFVIFVLLLPSISVMFIESYRNLSVHGVQVCEVCLHVGTYILSFSVYQSTLPGVFHIKPFWFSEEMHSCYACLKIAPAVK